MIARRALRGNILQRTDEDRDVAERIARRSAAARTADTKVASISRSRSRGRRWPRASATGAIGKTQCGVRRRQTESKRRRDASEEVTGGCGWPSGRDAADRKARVFAHELRRPPARSGSPSALRHPLLVVPARVAGGDDQHGGGADEWLGPKHQRLGDLPPRCQAHRRPACDCAPPPATRRPCS